SLILTSSRLTEPSILPRRTESHDIPNIISLMKYDTERLFGRINVIYLLQCLVAF
uniref:Cilia- and flagella-associated protein 61 N-terminal domain-containing protein n=1 Tax=Naja naja TaxID=35670 RepID=A0A8C6XMD9_NAJNA